MFIKSKLQNTVYAQLNQILRQFSWKIQSAFCQGFLHFRVWLIFNFRKQKSTVLCDLSIILFLFLLFKSFQDGNTSVGIRSGFLNFTNQWTFSLKHVNFDNKFVATLDLVFMILLWLFHVDYGPYFIFRFVLLVIRRVMSSHLHEWAFQFKLSQPCFQLIFVYKVGQTFLVYCS